MKLTVLTTILLVLPLKVISCPLAGYWKSDEEKTLASFRQVIGATQKQKEVFENNFFGNLYIHIECEKLTSVMDDWMETKDYELVSFTDESVIISYASILEGVVTLEATIENDCYFIDVMGGQFKEYFCPVSADAYSGAIKLAQEAMRDDQ